MSTPVEARQIANLARELKAAARGDLRRLLLKDIRPAARPLIDEAKKSALENLPKSGGLAAEVASTEIKVRTSLSGSYARLRLVGISPHRLRSLDAGRVRHPVFGDLSNWVTQDIKPGWWTTAMEAESPEVRKAIVRSVETVQRSFRG
jgi:hypothetical protein